MQSSGALRAPVRRILARAGVSFKYTETGPVGLLLLSAGEFRLGAQVLLPQPATEPVYRKHQ